MMKPVKIEILVRGQVLVNHAHMIKRGKNVVAITMDLKSKYALVTSWGSGTNEPPCIYLQAHFDETLYIDTTKDEGSATVVQFPDFVNWSIFTATIGRYTANICLIK